MNAQLVYPPAMPASMAAASGDGNGPATRADPLLVVGATYALVGRGNELPPAARRLLASPTRRASATHQTLMGGLLLMFGDALLG